MDQELFEKIELSIRPDEQQFAFQWDERLTRLYLKVLMLKLPPF